ncbi:sensor histidine kinase [Streptomyces griseocarneus]|uniref:sensor histidine kinase n=1 Tax=Streptomyces griseocarneus TaxID=51201 RepID=UPI0019CE7B23|nr:histidine kinase [Streptomyces griseocarneus]MBZ6471822.1 histidine kinase [Streptomyces griseocarneus]GHG71048.1 histidine kinase [Streptomyces griseocarneus]
MTAALRRLAGATLGHRARLRWVHLLLGGALLMPYYLLTSTVVSVFVPGAVGLFLRPSVAWQFATFALSLPPAAVMGLYPLVRPLTAGAVRALCGVPREELDARPSRSWAARGRTATWHVLHLLAGGIVSGMSLAAPPAALYLLVLPLLGDTGRARDTGWGLFFRGPGLALAPVAGLGLLALVVGTSWAAGTLLARCAPVLLGPTAADRLAEAEQHAMRLALRNRLARELHDSVGHALSAVSLQASAARRVLESDPEFARQALAAIEETTREAVGELDTVLGLLREDGPASSAPAPTLAGLDGLLQRTRAAGGTVDCAAPRGLEKIPPVVSREAYRIVQEGLSNALRHAGPVPVALRITLDDDDLEVTLENPVRPTAAHRRPGGGRGLTGIAERARLLRGSAASGERDGVWRLSVRLPLRGDAR